MLGEPRQGPRRRGSVGVELLEGRALLNAAGAPAPPGVVELNVVPSSPVVNQQEASFTATIYLKQLMNDRKAATLAAPLTVDFSAVQTPNDGGAPGAAGANPAFLPFHESVTIPAGVSAETVTVPIRLAAPLTATSSESVGLSAISGHAYPASGLPAYVSLVSSPESVPPTITGVQLVTQGKLASAVVLSFSKPMARATVEDVSNYKVLSRLQETSTPGFLFWRGSLTYQIRSFPIASASYDPSASTVTLTLKHPVRASSLYEVASPNPVQGHDLTDTEGRSLVSTSSSSYFGSVTSEGFTNLIHPIPGFIPSQAVGPARVLYHPVSPVVHLFSI